MHRTYELYVRRPNGHVQFEPLTHAGSSAEIFSHIRGLLEQTGAESIEVREAGRPMFTLLASDPAD
jgi:hypothetical protein